MYCYYPMGAAGNPPDLDPPQTLDWEQWTGPAPMRPYHEQIHPRQWRSYMEYGNGIVGDMCIHMLDMARWMLDLGWPRRISSLGGIFVEPRGRANITDTQSVTFDFGDLTMTWQHRTWGNPSDPQYRWGADFYGDRGSLKVDLLQYEFTPHGDGLSVHRDAPTELDQYPDEMQESDMVQKVHPAGRAHMRDFLHAVRTRSRPVADIEEGHISTASCVLASLSQQLGRSLTWNAEYEEVVHDEEANLLLERPYRGPWVHPEPAAV